MRTAWRIDPLRPDPTFGYIRAVAKNPATGKGYAINVTDEDPKLVLDGIDLTVPHDGTPVEFTAGKVPSHEVY